VVREEFFGSKTHFRGQTNLPETEAWGGRKRGGGGWGRDHKSLPDVLLYNARYLTTYGTSFETLQNAGIVLVL
jgi:hypothetical protein